ncbi:MAG: thiamine diphosphokinase [Tannerella sp.]|jgi:thiamine pyrophosphokinase|nr:thiamine diphosphokinase [Tannerella sp.]
MDNFYDLMTTDADAVILAAGDFPTHPVPLQLLEKYRERIICCDGAVGALLKAGYQPFAVVGDGDSISTELRRQVSGQFIHITEQETNDLSKSVYYAYNMRFTRLIILGATGKREDHTLGNISLLADYMENAEVRMFTDHGVLTPCTGHSVFASQRGQQVSVFCMDTSPLTLRGLRWPVENRHITRWWQATLNEALSNRFKVITDSKVIVFQSYEK